MRLTVFTSNSKGGVLQFAEVIARYARNIVDSVILVVPENADLQDYKDIVYRYKSKSTLNPYDKGYKTTAEYVIANSDAAIICDDALIASAIAINVSKKIPVLLVVHDVRPHYTDGLKLLKRRIKLFITEAAYRSVEIICLLSMNSKNEFLLDYPMYREKVITVKLGAHLTTTNLLEPTELHGINNYILFFGRIDQYKGIERLIKEYYKSEDKFLPQLVIAGSGNIQIYENFKKDSIIFLNRYISNEEMNWLFVNCCVVVLPYTQATQSGVIPIAYHYNKPVLVSDLPGLTENVIEHKTGEIFRDDSELISKLMQILTNKSNYNYITEYYDENYNWNAIVCHMIDRLNDTNGLFCK